MQYQRLLSVGLVSLAAAIGLIGPLESQALESQALVAGSAAREEVEPTAIVAFNVYLPLSHPDALEKKLRDQTDPASPDFQRWLTPAEFRAQFGPDPAAVATVAAELASAGFTVVGRTTQALQVRGSAGAIQGLFAARLQRVGATNGRPRLVAAERQLTLPASLARLGAVIPEFAALEEKRTHSVRFPVASNSVDANVRLSDALLYYPNDMRESYRFPSFLDHVAQGEPGEDGPLPPLAGVGSHIAILIDSTILPGDLAATFNSGFLLRDSGGGWYGQGVTAAPLVDGNVARVLVDAVLVERRVRVALPCRRR